jgi:ribosome biogenesis protein Tsr3
MSITMLTALLYNLDHKHREADKKALEAEYSRGYEQGSQCAYDGGWESNFKNLQERVEAYEKASGLSIEYGWNRPEKVGETVRALLEGPKEIKQLLSSAKWGVNQAERNKEALQRYVEILEKVVNIRKPEEQG